MVGMMEEREEFEKLPDINAILHNSEFGFNEGINQYYHPNHAEHRLSYAFLMGAWLAWQAAKAQAVPEGFVLMPMVPSQRMVNAVRGCYEGEAYLPYSLYSEFVNQAMIEAQEQSHESN